MPVDPATAAAQLDGTPELFIAGTGVSPLTDMSVGTVRLLEQADQIITIISSPLDAWLPAGAHSIPVHRLNHLYAQHRPRLDNYRAVADEIVDLARGTRRSVFLTPGCPTVYDRVVTLVLEQAHAAGLKVSLSPAVSSIEACLTALREDMAPGIQIFEARWFVARHIVPCTEVGCLFVQPGVFTTDQVGQPDDLEPTRLQGLEEYLRSFYDPGHPVVFVRAPSAVDDPGYLRVTLLEDLCLGLREDLMGTTLYVPAVDRAEPWITRQRGRVVSPGRPRT